MSQFIHELDKPQPPYNWTHTVVEARSIAATDHQIQLVDFASWKKVNITSVSQVKWKKSCASFCKTNYFMTINSWYSYVQLTSLSPPSANVQAVPKRKMQTWVKLSLTPSKGPCMHNSTLYGKYWMWAMLAHCKVIVPE